LNQWIQVFGRFHPLVLHMPIGLLAGVAAIEAVTLFKRDAAWVAVARFIAVLAAASAVFTAVTGYVLSLSGDYDGGPVELHRNLGIAVAVASVLTAAFYFYQSSPWPRRIALAICMACLLPAGHLGATMTHGENFLFAPLDAKPEKPARAAPPERASDPEEPGNFEQTPTDKYNRGEQPTAAASPTTHFETVIAPILAQRCSSCHSATKQKGELALHTREAILKGGEYGPVIVPGNVKDSELVTRLRLSIDDDEHMPPRAKPQPTEQEITAIEAWIASGASFTDLSVSPGAASSEVVPRAKSPTKSAEPKAGNQMLDLPDAEKPSTASLNLAEAPLAAIQALRDRFIHVAPIAQDSNLLVVDPAAVAAQIDDQQARELLAPLHSNLADVSLARTRVTDASMPFLAAFPSLRRLDLRATAVSTSGIATLKSSTTINELVLSQTRLDDGAVAAIVEMPSLLRVYLWKSGITPEGIDRLRRERPKLFVDAGDRAVTTITTTESEIKLSSDAPVTGAPPSIAQVPSQTTTQAADLAPANTVCPVSGSPVVAKYSIVHNGRVIGFCCPNCPKEFWADSAKFESKLR